MSITDIINGLEKEYNKSKSISATDNFGEFSIADITDVDKILSTGSYISICGLVFQVSYDYSKEIGFENSSIVTNDNIMASDNSIQRPPKINYEVLIENPMSILDLLLRSMVFNTAYGLTANIFGASNDKTLTMLSGLWAYSTAKNNKKDNTASVISSLVYGFFATITSGRFDTFFTSFKFSTTDFEKEYGELINDYVIDDVSNLSVNFFSKHSTFITNFLANELKDILTSGSILNSLFLEPKQLASIKLPSEIIFSLLQLLLNIKKNLPLPSLIHLPRLGWINGQIASMNYNESFKSRNYGIFNIVIDEYSPVVTRFITTSNQESSSADSKNIKAPDIKIGK